MDKFIISLIVLSIFGCATKQENKNNYYNILNESLQLHYEPLETTQIINKNVREKFQKDLEIKDFELSSIKLNNKRPFSLISIPKGSTITSEEDGSFFTIEDKKKNYQYFCLIGDFKIGHVSNKLFKSINQAQPNVTNYGESAKIKLVNEIAYYNFNFFSFFGPQSERQVSYINIATMLDPNSLHHFLCYSESTNKIAFNTITEQIIKSVINTKNNFNFHEVKLDNKTIGIVQTNEQVNSSPVLNISMQKYFDIIPTINGKIFTSSKFEVVIENHNFDLIKSTTGIFSNENMYDVMISKYDNTKNKYQLTINQTTDPKEKEITLNSPHGFNYLVQKIKSIAKMNNTKIPQSFKVNHFNVLEYKQNQPEQVYKLVKKDRNKIIYKLSGENAIDKKIIIHRKSGKYSIESQNLLPKGKLTITPIN